MIDINTFRKREEILSKIELVESKIKTLKTLYWKNLFTKERKQIRAEIKVLKRVCTSYKIDYLNN